jgi:hypothetical protein
LDHAGQRENAAGLCFAAIFIGRAIPFGRMTLSSHFAIDGDAKCERNAACLAQPVTDKLAALGDGPGAARAVARKMTRRA